MAKKNNNKHGLCADSSNLSETERGIMARAMKAGQEQINFLRKQAENNPNSEEEEE